MQVILGLLLILVLRIGVPLALHFILDVLSRRYHPAAPLAG